MKDVSQARTLLGKKVDAPAQYDPSILVRVNRSDNRKQYSIDDQHLPFVGYDVWNAYEVSFLTSTGLPIALVAKIVYPATNPYIVESKSLKLYLNSFNMTRVEACSESEATNIVKKVVKTDLSRLLGTDVAIEVFRRPQNTKVFKYYPVLEVDKSLKSVEFTNFNEDSSILLKNIRPVQRPYLMKFRCDLLRSNCKITHQADWGTLFVHIISGYRLCKASLLQYIVSFRNEYHFHEEVVEMIYKRLYDLLTPQDLMVGAIYTRRGGIDICPIRASRDALLDQNLINPSIHCEKTLRQ